MMSFSPPKRNRGLRARVAAAYRRLLPDGGLEDQLDRPALVLAPHPDDETLACGGLIARKRAARADVWIVILTDGRHSHSRLLDGEQLARLRRQEALAAAKRLGVRKSRVLFLGHEDGRLEAVEESVRGEVLAILGAVETADIFFPCREESPADHAATHRIVRYAAQRLEGDRRYFEYPVWFWNQWPFTPLQAPRRLALPARIGRTLLSNLRLLGRFRHAIPIREQLDLKSAALAEYRTQTTRYRPDCEWPILQDVAGGEFLECFFQDRELFHLRKSP
jgi:LmbE family N-acetylglucosaminyl deacetylase